LYRIRGKDNLERQRGKKMTRPLRAPAPTAKTEPTNSGAGGAEQRVYFGNVDSLRFFAFLWVFLYHIEVPWGHFWTIHINGFVGVELFFVISSFLLTRLLVLEYRKSGGVSLKKYFMRRILRIWPLYFTFIIVMIAISEATHPGSVSTISVVRLFTFTDNLWASLTGWTTDIVGVAHLWTISLEEQYYLLLPFIIPALAKLPKRAVLIAGFTVIVILCLMRLAAVVYGMHAPFIWASPIQCDGFVLGTMLGLGVFDDWLAKVPSWAEIVVGLFITGVTFLLPPIAPLSYGDVIRYTMYGVAFVLILDAVITSKSPVMSAVLGNKVLAYLGKISFGLYVFHFIVTRECMGRIGPLLGGIENFSPLKSIAFVVFAAGLTILISWLSYELFEKRFLRLKERFTTVKSRPI